MFEIFVIGEGVPAARHLRIGMADVDACDPEARRAAVGPSGNVEVRRAGFVPVYRMAVHEAAEIGAVLPPFIGEADLVVQAVRRADADDVSQLVEGRHVVMVAVGVRR